MPHDKTGVLLKAGDRVALFGTVKEITSGQETYCNILFEAEEKMAPDAEPYQLSLSARQVEHAGPKQSSVSGSFDGVPVPTQAEG
jgi:hypothetical protein